jgi:hypothetical protein
MVYAAKCYWPGVTEQELARAAARAVSEAARVSRAGTAVAYVGSLLFADDELVLCLFESPVRAAVKETYEHARIPCERLMESIWLAGPGQERNRQCANA